MECPKTTRLLILSIRIALLWCTITISLCPLLVHAETGRPLAIALRNNVVSIAAYRKTGSPHYGFGFIVAEKNGKLFIATANHVVRDDVPGGESSRVKVRYYSDLGKQYDAKLLQTSDKIHDLAVLEAPFPSGFGWRRGVLTMEILDFLPVIIESGDHLWFIGRTRRWFIPKNYGIVKEVIKDRYEILAQGLPVQVGTSGAPLVSDRGIIGMVVSDENIHGITGGLRIDFIKKAMDKWNIPWDLVELDEARSSADVEFYMKRGLRNLEDWKLNQAIVDFGQVIRFSGWIDAEQTYQAYTNRGIAYHKKGEYLRAVENYDKAIALNLGLLDAHEKKGIALVEKGDYDSAILTLLQVTIYDPQSWQGRYFLGLAFLRRGNIDRAIESFTNVLRIKPDNGNAYYYRGFAHKINGKKESAINDFRKVFTSPGDPSLHQQAKDQLKELGVIKAETVFVE